MKKILFLAAVAIAVVSCKKENPAAPTTNEGSRIKEQVANVIEKADPGLYASIYNNEPNYKAPLPIVSYTPGYFIIPSGGSVDDGYCIGSSGVCYVFIKWKMLIEGETPEPKLITEDLHEGYTEQGEGTLFINCDPEVVIENLKSLDIELGNGSSTVEWSVLDI